MKSTTAILLFSRNATQEARAKQFVTTKDATLNQRVAAALIDYSKGIAERSGLPLLSVAQRGDTFGERLHNAFAEGFAMGYEQIIAIGNDCPTLTTDHLLEAEQLLQKQDVVLGPAKDGGAYLIGLSRRSFSQLPFINLAWNTAHLFEEFVQAVTQLSLTVAQLTSLKDIDSAKDLQLFLRLEGAALVFGQLIRKLLFAKEDRPTLIPTFYSCVLALFGFTRPPPASLSL